MRARAMRWVRCERAKERCLLLHRLLFLAAACSDLTRRDLDVDRVRFISPPHAKACKRARLTGNRYLGSVAALYRGASASAARRIFSRARGPRDRLSLMENAACSIRYPEPRRCRYDSVDYNASQLPIPCTFGGKNDADRKHVGVGDASDHLVHNICARELNRLNSLSDKSSLHARKAVSR